MSYSASQVANRFRFQAEKLSLLAQRHRDLASHLARLDADLASAAMTARRELAAVYLPAISDEDFARVARLTGFQGFARRDPRTAMDHERHVLEAAISKLEADERYQLRSVRVGGDGTLTQERDLAVETLAPLQEACDRFEQLPEFLKLVEIGYDTPRFSVKWWHPSYWKYWAAGDRICKTLMMDDFGDNVIPAYEKYAEPRDVMRAEVQRLDKAIDEIHALVQEHDRQVHRLTNLATVYLQEAQDFLGEHLASADGGLLEQWATGEAPEISRAVQIGVRKIAGIAAKRDILNDMTQRGLPQAVTQLEQRCAKAIAKADKFDRPKYASRDFPEDIVDERTFDERTTVMEAQLDKLQRRVDGLIASERYAGFDLRSDRHRWWWYLTQTQPPRYAPQHYDYYQRNPDAALVPDPAFDLGEDAGDAVAAALISADREQGGYLS